MKSIENNDFLDAIRQMKSRFEPELSRLRYDKEQVRQTQILRAEQNREYEESLKQDQERVGFFFKIHFKEIKF